MRSPAGAARAHAHFRIWAVASGGNDTGVVMATSTGHSGYTLWAAHPLPPSGARRRPTWPTVFRSHLRCATRPRRACEGALTLSPAHAPQRGIGKHAAKGPLSRPRQVLALSISSLGDHYKRGPPAGCGSPPSLVPRRWSPGDPTASALVAALRPLATAGEPVADPPSRAIFAFAGDASANTAC